MIQPIHFYLLGAFIVAMIIANIVLPNILLISHKKRLFDMPDKRKVHHAPIPRLGGLSFFPVMLITMGGHAFHCAHRGVRNQCHQPD